MSFCASTSANPRAGIVVATALLAAVAAAGCTTMSTRDATTSSRTAPVESQQAGNTTQSQQSREAAEARESSGVSAEVLAERRRSDYPEIATNETGFTITEQVRIAGTARSDYEQALVFLRQERWQQGIALLVAVTEAAPDVTAPYVDLGIAYERSGDLELATATLESARLLSPDHPIVHNELGIIYRKTGRFADARASYEKALAVFADFHYARRNLGVLCDLYLADLDCALENYTAYMTAVGEDPEVQIWISDIRSRLGLQGDM